MSKRPYKNHLHVKAVGIPPPRVVKNSGELWNTGIIYPSIKGKGNCLAVFVRNFQNESSWLELVDNLPNEKVIHKLDASTYLNLM